MKAFEKFINALTGVEYWVTVPIFMVMLTIMFVQVVFRYALQLPLSWSEEMARLLFVIATFLGASIATAERGHIEINFVEMTITKYAKSKATQMKAGIAMNILRDIGTIVCLLLVGWQTYTLMVDQYIMQGVSTAMGFPFWVITGLMLLGFVLSIVHSVGLIILNLGGYGPFGYEFADGEDCQCS